MRPVFIRISTIVSHSHDHSIIVSHDHSIIVSHDHSTIVSPSHVVLGNFPWPCYRPQGSR